MRRYGMLDDQWERIGDLLPGQEGHVGVTAANNRLFVEAVLYRYRTGMPWRDLPERFGDWKNVHQRFSRWAKSGVWERVFQHLAVEADNEYAMQPVGVGSFADEYVANGRLRILLFRRTADYRMKSPICS